MASEFAPRLIPCHLMWDRRLVALFRSMAPALTNVLRTTGHHGNHYEYYVVGITIEDRNHIGA